MSVVAFMFFVIILHDDEKSKQGREDDYEGDVVEKLMDEQKKLLEMKAE